MKRGTLTEMVVAFSPLPADRYATTDEFAQRLMGELLKLGTPPTKPQLGEYVRARCVTDFTTQRSPPPAGEAAKTDMFAETMVRTPSPSGVATAVHRGQSAPTQVPPVEPLPPPVPTATDQPAVTAPQLTSPARPSVIAAPTATPSSPERPSVRLDVAAVAAPSAPPLTANELAAAAPEVVVNPPAEIDAGLA